MAWFKRGLFIVALVTAACGPETPQTPQVGLAIGAAESQNRIQIDPTYPDEPALLDLTLAVGLTNSTSATDTVTLDELELRAAGQSLELGGEFHQPDLDSSASFHLEPVYDAQATNAAASFACGASDAVLHVEVSGATYGKASADVPVTIDCLPDRRAPGDLATRALGANPPGMPCEIDGTFETRLGWDAAGRLEIEEFTDPGGAVNRTVVVHDDAGHVTDVYRMSDGILLDHTRFTYDQGRVATSTFDDFGGSPSTLQMSWTSDSAMTAGSYSYALSGDGLTVTDTGPDRTITTTYQDPIDLTSYRTGLADATTAAFHETGATISTSQGQITQTVEYSGNQITGTTVGGAVSPVSYTWKYTCSF